MPWSLGVMGLRAFRLVRRPPAYSLPVLVAFVLGGLAAPLLHRVWHAEEQAQVRAEHASAGHHHHIPADPHGDEATAPCPTPAALDLQCVLCHGVSVYLEVAPVAVLAPASLARQRTPPSARPVSTSAGLLSIRGPPGRIA